MCSVGVWELGVESPSWIDGMPLDDDGDDDDI